MILDQYQEISEKTSTALVLTKVEKNNRSNSRLFFNNNKKIFSQH